MLRLILGQFITHIEMLIPVDMLLQNGDAIYKGSVNQRKFTTPCLILQNFDRNLLIYWLVNKIQYVLDCLLIALLLETI